MPDVLLPYSLTFSRMAIGLAFAASSMGKLRDFPTLERGIGNFQILPRRLARACAHLFTLQAKGYDPAVLSMPAAMPTLVG